MNWEQGIPRGPEAPVGAFDHQPRTRIVFGAGSLERLGDLTRELPARRVLLVTDRGIVAAGHAARARALLEAAGLNVWLFDGVEENPTTDCVNAGLAVAQAGQIDAFVALGGGSSLDTAKGCNFLLTNGGAMRDYWGVGKASKPLRPLIAVPTTAGTGSECQSFALISDPRTHQKMACGDPKAAPRVALLDPQLTLSQPERVAAITGIDALAHAVESAVTNKRTVLSLMYSRQAFQLLSGGLPTILKAPRDLAARGRMQLGAALAGLAIENSMLGAAHSAANPLTARYGLVHGQAVGLMLPHVVRYNSREIASRETYADLALAAGLVSDRGETMHAVERLIAFLKEMLDLARLPKSLSACGVEQQSMVALAKEAAGQWTAPFNPRPAVERDFVALYQAAW